MLINSLVTMVNYLDIIGIRWQYEMCKDIYYSQAIYSTVWVSFRGHLTPSAYTKLFTKYSCGQ